MKTIFFVAFLALPLAASAQTTQKPDAAKPAPQYGQGGSPHCDKLSGAQREQCLKDEGAKTDTSRPTDSSASGSSAATPKAPEKEKKDPY